MTLSMATCAVRAPKMSASPRKVVLVTRNLPPLTGGMERLNWHLAHELAESFDVFVCSHYRTTSDLENATASRGFPAEEIPNRMADSLLARGIDEGDILIIDDWRNAIKQGLEIAEAGDLLVFFSAEVDWPWNQITTYCRERG